MGDSMYCTLKQAIEDFRDGKFLVLVDAHEREDEGEDEGGQ